MSEGQSGLGFGRRKLIEKIIEDNWEITVPSGKTYTYNEILYIIQEMVEEEGKQYLEPGTPMRGFQVFKDFVKHLLYRNIANFDSMVLITSDKGMGKSSSAMMMARFWCKLIGIRFDPKRHIAYNNGDVMRKIDLLNKFEPLICDEAVRFASACVIGETKIKLPIGEVLIKNLVGKKDFKVYSFNEKIKKEEIQIAEECIYTGKREVFEVELEDGRKIQATKEHKFLTVNGWKMLSELNYEDDLLDK